MLTHARTFPGLPEEVRRARHWTRDVLGNSPLTDDAALIVTELGTNAVLHTKSATDTFNVTLLHAPEALFISVTDRGSSTTTPHAANTEAGDTHGRGLNLVIALAHHVHISGDHRGHTVTAELRPTPPSTSTYPRPYTGAATC